MDILINIALIIIGVLLFCLIILIHEFGHFSMAKLFSVCVNEFSIGMGPKLLQTQKGETLYTLRALPIGGYCAMEGEEEDSDSPNSFEKKSVWKRILIVAMGGVLNILLGFILMLIILSTQNVYASNTVAQFADNASTSASGLMVGDEITSFDGYSIFCDQDLFFAFSMSNSVRESIKENRTECYVNMTVKRDNNEVNLNNVKFDIAGEENSKYLSLDFKVQGVQRNFFTLLEKSFTHTIATVRMVWASLVGLVMGRFGINDMAGPIGTATAISQTAAAGLADGFATAVSNIVYVMIIITVNLGIFNLLPIPALDGGRLVFLFIEAIFRRPISPKVERWVHKAGFLALIVFMLFVTYNDIFRLITGNGVAV